MAETLVSSLLKAFEKRETLQRLLKTIYGSKPQTERLRKDLEDVINLVGELERESGLTITMTPVVAVNALAAYKAYKLNRMPIGLPIAQLVYGDRELRQYVRTISRKTGVPASGAAAFVAAVLASVYEQVISSNPDIDLSEAMRKIAELARKVTRYYNEISRAERSAGIGGVDPLDYITQLVRIAEIVEQTVNAKPSLPREARRLAKRAYELMSRVIEAANSSRPYGVIYGVRPMKSLDELGSLTSTERAALALSKLYRGLPLGRALDAINAYKIAAKQLLVYDRSVLPAPVIYIDKSGSMDSQLPGMLITSYTAAAAIAAGIIEKTKTPSVILFDTIMYDLTPFDLRPEELEKILFVIEPDGGTNIEAVLYDILAKDTLYKKKARKRPFYILITDTDAVVSDEIIEKLKKNKIADRIAVIVVKAKPQDWVKKLPHYAVVLESKDLVKAINKIAAAAARALTKA